MFIGTILFTSILGNYVNINYSNNKTSRDYFSNVLHEFFLTAHLTCSKKYKRQLCYYKTTKTIIVKY